MPGIGVGIGIPFRKHEDESDYWTNLLIERLQEDMAIWNNFDGIWLLSRLADDESYLTELKGTGKDATKTGSGNLYYDKQYGVYSDEAAALNLNFNPRNDGSALTITSSSFGYYLVDDNVFGSNGVFGTYDASTYLFGSGKNPANGRVNFAVNSAGINYKTPTWSRGLFIVNNDNGTLELFIDGVSAGQAARTPTALPNKNLWALYYNNNDAAIPTGSVTLNRMGLVFTGGKWTTAQIATLNSIFFEYFTGIGTVDRALIRDTSLAIYKREQWITVYQHGNKILARSYGQMLYSSDGGQAWNTYNFASAGEVATGYIWDNGNITFCTFTKVYFSNNGLSTVSEITIKDTDGVTNYVPHTPENALYPGQYFRIQQYAKKQYIGANEVFVVGNYANVQSGAAPVNVYHFYNNGANVKLAYKFGQNPYYRDNGTPTGGATGTLLGDAANAEWCRHIHSVSKDPDTGTFYLCTGDSLRAEQNEVKWFTGTYNTDTEIWSWTKIYEAAAVDRMKAVGLIFINGEIWWGSDDTVGGDFGIYKCAKANIATLGSHVRMYQVNNLIVSIDIQGTKLVAGKETSTGERHPVIISSDLANFSVLQLEYIPGKMPNFYPIIPPDANGYFCLVPFGSGNTLSFYPTIHIKVK